VLDSAPDEFKSLTNQFLINERESSLSERTNPNVSLEEEAFLFSEEVKTGKRSKSVDQISEKSDSEISTNSDYRSESWEGVHG